MAEVLETLIATVAVVTVSLAAMRIQSRGNVRICSRLDSLERRMAAIEAYLRPNSKSATVADLPPDALAKPGDKPA